MVETDGEGQASLWRLVFDGRGDEKGKRWGKKSE